MSTRRCTHYFFFCTTQSLFPRWDFGNFSEAITLRGNWKSYNIMQKSKKETPLNLISFDTMFFLKMSFWEYLGTITLKKYWNQDLSIINLFILLQTPQNPVKIEKGNFTTFYFICTTQSLFQRWDFGNFSGAITSRVS